MQIECVCVYIVSTVTAFGAKRPCIQKPSIQPTRGKNYIEIRSAIYLQSLLKQDK